LKKKKENAKPHASQKKKTDVLGVPKSPFSRTTELFSITKNNRDIFKTMAGSHGSN
jgi:hypothetical protein